MTGPAHRMAGVGAALACLASGWSTSPISALFGASALYAGSMAPDWLEFRNARSGITLLRHRTLTHWAVMWVIGGAVSVLYLPAPLGFAGICFALGGLIHLSGDALTPMGVPVIHPVQRRTIALKIAPIYLEWFWLLSIWLLSGLYFLITKGA